MNRREQLAKDNGMTIEFVNWFFDNKKDGCGNAWLVMMAAMWESWKHLSEQRDALAADNAALKSKGRELLNEACGVYEKYNATINPENGDFMDGQTLHEFQFLMDVETPATDAFLREVRNEAGARAVELFSQTLGSPYTERDERCYEDGFTHAIEVVRGVQAPRFAAKLRQGGAA